MDNSNYKDLASQVRSELPFYLQQNDYDNFVKFLELYYEWMSQETNTLDVGAEILDYSDLDNTLDIFVDEFKHLLAEAFPNTVQVKNKNQINSELSGIFGVSPLENERFESDDFLGNGVSSEFSISYREPSFYEGKTVTTRVVDFKVYVNPTTGQYTDESLITRSSETPSQVFANLTFPDDFVELVKDEDYIVSEDRIIFYDKNTGQIVAPTDQVAIRVLYRLKTTNASTGNNKSDIKKTKFTNKKQFLKLMKEFYLAKGSEKSYEFLFRTFFNEDISFYYPKENVFKVSNNEWTAETSIRTQPSTNAVTNPIRVVGETSKAFATVERYQEYSLSGNAVREYFISSIFGEFQDQENVFIENENGVTFKEKLWTCVTGFDIQNPGRNYPRNMYLNSFISSAGSGTGFGARITNTTDGQVDSIEIVNEGDNYITGEEVIFEGEGTFGSGAIGTVTKVTGVTEDKNITWVQHESNDTYPNYYWDFSDGGETFTTGSSRNEVVDVRNIDNYFDNVTTLLDFETMTDSRNYKEYKNSLQTLRTNAKLETPLAGPLFGNESTLFTNGFVEVKDAAIEIAGEDELIVDFWYLPVTLDTDNSRGSALFSIGASDGTYNAFTLWQKPDNTIIIQNKDSEVASVVLPISYSAWNHIAVHSVVGSGTKIYLNGALVLNALSVDCADIESTDRLFIAADSDAGLGSDDPPPTRQQIFDTWGRFSHDSSNNFPADASDLNAFTYNSSLDRIECTTNLARLTGFYSPSGYSQYDFGVTVTASGGDNDTIGALIGFYKDPDTGKEHSLSVLRSMQGTLSGGGYQIWYNHLQSDAELVFDGNSLAPGLAGDWQGNKSRIKVTRDVGDVFTVSVSQFTTNATHTDADLDPTTEHTFKLSDYSWGNVFAGLSPYGYCNHSQGGAAWEDTEFRVFGELDMGDYIAAYFDSFRITKGNRYTTFLDAANSNVETLYEWELDPVEKSNIAVNAENTKNSNAKYYYAIANNKLTIMEEIYDTGGKPETWDSITGLLSDTTGFVDDLTIRSGDDLKSLRPVPIPDYYSVTINWTEMPRGGVKRVDLMTGGFGYIIPPSTFVSEQTGSYVSQGLGATLLAKGDTIGGIKDIKITQNDPNDAYDGFGIGYVTPPTLDLTGLGDGTAVVVPITGPLCVRDGSFVSDQGFLSDNNRIHDSYLWQDYSYVIQVGRVIDEWRDIVKKVIHPAGMMMFGELTLLSKVEGKRLKDAYLFLFYEIIKNVDVTVKNMDGLGVWTGQDTDPQNSNDIMSHGYTIVYNNRQSAMNELYGVGDDTPAGQSVDTGSGRYVLLGDGFTNATTWNEVKYVGLNQLDGSGKDYSFFYGGEILERTFTIYNISEKNIVDDEWKSTRPWAKYKIISAVEDSVNNTIMFGVVLENSYLNLPNESPLNNIEFRWDKKTRGNVERVNSSWIGSIRDGANPRDEKFIVKIQPKELPDSGSTYKSLERFKFNFSAIFPFDNLVRYRFSPYEEAQGSPYLDYYGFDGEFNNINMKGTQHTIMQNPNGDNTFGMVPTYGNNQYLGVTDGTDHDWQQETIQNIMASYDKSYRAVLDAHVNLMPKHLVISKDTAGVDGPLLSGMTFASIERMKFNQTPQSVDNNLYLESIDDVMTKYNTRTNITHETIIQQYSTEPTSFAELKELQQI
jgi:hypothetical protein